MKPLYKKDRLTAPLVIYFAMVISATAARLDESCIVSALNRSARVRADGTWRIDNVPANLGLVRVRATCLQNGVTFSGQSDFTALEPNIDNGFRPFSLGNASPIPSMIVLASSITNLSG